MRPVQISRRNEVDRRAETDGKIVMVEAVGSAPRNATVVEADHLTPQRGHADEAGHRIGTEPPGETRRKIQGVEATGYASKSATPVEGDLIRKQIEAAVVAPERLTIRRLGAARTVLGNTSLIVNSLARTLAPVGLPRFTLRVSRGTTVFHHGRRPGHYLP
jgi:hypothetical protein